MTEIIIALISAAVLIAATFRNCANSSANRSLTKSELAMIAGAAGLVAAMVISLF